MENHITNKGGFFIFGCDMAGSNESYKTFEK